MLLYLVDFGTWSLIVLLFSAIGGAALSLAYGIEIEPINDPFIELADQTAKSVAKAGSVGAFLIDLIPILKYIPEFVPGAGFKKQARIGRKLLKIFREQPYLASVEAMVCIFTTYLYWSKLLFRPLATFDLHSHQLLWGMSTKVAILITNEKL